MANKILAVLEQREGLLKKSAFETVFVAANLAVKLKLDAEAVVVGSSIENVNEIAKYGIKKIVHLKSDDLKNYSSSAYTD
ncbi:MAG TPA: hypothetical protein VI362_03000, partial [Ignavibacteriaceae bacterium]|nr:hypothetical protein [Ignavibacteriaceae bacterium]